MGGIALAWLFGEGILVWRWRKAGAPPPPGALLLSSGVFAGLALLGQWQQARTLAAVTAWGYDLAILLQVLGQGKVPKVAGWPPPKITNPNVILPDGKSHGAASQYGGAVSGVGDIYAGSFIQGVFAGAGVPISPTDANAFNKGLQTGGLP